MKKWVALIVLGAGILVILWVLWQKGLLPKKWCAGRAAGLSTSGGTITYQ